jgi:hypothetical protein
LKGLKNGSEEYLAHWQQSDLCEPGLQHISDADSVISTVKGSEE